MRNPVTGRDQAIGADLRVDPVEQVLQQLRIRGRLVPTALGQLAPFPVGREKMRQAPDGADFPMRQQA